eukprot:COSAG06_NODE_1934_length_8038_cov_12.181383_3_plen_217_part_00
MSTRRQYPPPRPTTDVGSRLLSSAAPCPSCQPHNRMDRLHRAVASAHTAQNTCTIRQRGNITSRREARRTRIDGTPMAPARAGNHLLEPQADEPRSSWLLSAAQPGVAAASAPGPMVCTMVVHTAEDGALATGQCAAHSWRLKLWWSRTPVRLFSQSRVANCTLSFLPLVHDLRILETDSARRTPRSCCSLGLRGGTRHGGGRHPPAPRSTVAPVV